MFHTITGFRDSDLRIQELACSSSVLRFKDGMLGFRM